LAEARLSILVGPGSRVLGRSNSARRAALALFALLGSTTGADLSASDVSDAAAAARRLRERAAYAQRTAGRGPASAAGAASPPHLAQRDDGQIVVMEHDGSDYSRNEPDGSPNYLPRTEIARRFYQTHGDNYDFLVVFTNFEFNTPGVQAFHNQVRNDVRGIGRPVLDVGEWFGSPGRLKGYIDMCALDRYRQPPWSLTPGDPGYFWTLSTLAHEVAHQWLSYVRYQDPGEPGPPVGDLLGRDGVHWSYLLDSDASHMYGSDWVRQDDGRWRAVRIRDAFSPLDLYLMGFLPPAGAASFTLLRNPTVDPRQLPVEDAVIEAVPEAMVVEGVISAEGVRQPDQVVSQKEFRIAFVFLTAPGTEATATDLAIVDRIRQNFVEFFFAQTRGVALADTTLAEAPAPPTVPAPDLDRALAWLLSAQATDGSWSDTAATTPRDTAAALVALAEAGQIGAPYQTGRLWLQGNLPGNVDFLARRLLALATGPLGSGQQAALAASLEALRNPDGGFGPAKGYASDPLDTALALRALRALGRPAGASIGAALTTLAAQRDPAGGWPMVPGGEVSTVVTAEVLLALLAEKEIPAAQSLVPGALAALEGRRNPDGGFGESPSTPYATALAFTALAGAGAPDSALDPALAWLQGHQRDDGSWGGSRYETALVIEVLRGGTRPNLVVPADSLTFDPPAALEGQTVTVSLRVRNKGRGPAGASRARLYDGAPGLGLVVDEASVPPLAPGAEAALTLSFPTEGRAGQHALYVVADAASEVEESREDDNAATRSLSVVGKVPDLALEAAGIVVTPYPPASGETVEIAVTVANRGEKGSEASSVRLFRGDPRQGGQVLGDVPLPALAAGAAVTVTFAWDTTGVAPGTQTLVAFADPAFLLQESDETNNEAAIAVEVLAEAPAGPELEAVSLVPDPGSFTRIPQDIAVRASIRNRGRTAVTTSAALYDTDPPTGPPVAEEPLALGPRSSAVVTFTYRVTGPSSRHLVVRADPRNEVAEDDEDNNEARALLLDSQSTVDLELLPSEVALSASELAVGDVLTVTATIHNRGTAAVAGVPLVLFHAGPGGPVELARALLTLGPGAETTAVLRWKTALRGEPLPLLLRADPFDVLPELSEANNDVPLSVVVRPSSLTNLATSGALLAIDPNPPLEGGAAVLSLGVRNPSPVDAGAFTVAFYRGDPDSGGALIGAVPVAGLAAGDSATASLPWPSVDLRNVSGVFAAVDPEGRVAEYDETDNRAFLPLGSVGYADLVLTAGALTFSPAFPRAGQPVEVQAVVRNLGQRASPESRLRALEGEPGTLVTEITVPALSPGQSTALTFTWNPAGVGERVFAAQVDPADEVREADEGNNLARRTVVVQNADLYLTAPYFSPDGDGVQDETVLAYRATGTVSVVVSDGRGQMVRTLVENGPAEGSVAWDGRGEQGQILPDGVYTFTVGGAGGVVLGRASATLDTNRSPIHEAAGTRRIATRNLTCALEDVTPPAFMPSEEEALVIVPRSQGPYTPAGLVRLSLDGAATYLFQDEWYAAGAQLAGPDAVSPDGREVLVLRVGQLFAVDLQTGGQRSIGSSVYSYPGQVHWSPDGQLLAAGARLLRRDGSEVGHLPVSDSYVSSWAWSPDGRFLAGGNRIVSRDLGEERTIEVLFSFNAVMQTSWLEDGRIFARMAFFSEGERPPDACPSECAVLIDPVSGRVERLSWLEERKDPFSAVSWSPTGDRVLYGRYKSALGHSVAEVAYPDGSVPLELLRRDGVLASPRSRLAYFFSNEPVPGAACLGSGASDLYVAQSLENLVVSFTAARLPANDGLLLIGTVSDRHLDHWQLEYTPTSEPEGWRPLGPARETPVYDDVLAAWAPPQAGTYAVRLSARDRAGNQRSRVRVVAWDRVPAIANVSQSELLISPNGDGVKDEARFSYLVQEPTRLEVRITGALSGDPAAPPPPPVRAFGFDYPELGPQGFVWDGRDEGGQVVPDGRYTVELNGLPFRVDVDTTPPDIAFAWANVRTTVGTRLTEGGERQIGVLEAERRWHVVDANLKSWQADFVPDEVALVGDEQVFEPVRDAAGEVVYVDGLPQVKREGGRAVDRVDPEGSIALLGVHPGATFTARDHAGNVAVVPVPPVPEQLYVLDALDYVSFLPSPTDPRAEATDFRPLMVPPIAERDASGQEVVKPLVPFTDFDLAETLRGSPKGGESFRFQFQPRAGGAWGESPPTNAGPRLDFVGLGVDFTQVYRGRFACDAQNGRFFSESFLFRPCDDYMQLRLHFGPSAEWIYVVENSALEPLASGTIAFLDQNGVVTLPNGRLASDLPMSPDGRGGLTFLTPPYLRGYCARATAKGESGREYGHDGRCRNLEVGGCGAPPRGEDFSLASEPQLCGDPNLLRFRVAERAPGRHFFVEGDPDGEAFLVTTFKGEGALLPVVHEVLVDVSGQPDRDLEFRVRVEPAEGRVDIPEQRIRLHVDKTPPAAEVLFPAEGAAMCVGPEGATGREVVRFAGRAVDYARRMKVTTEFRGEGGHWVAVPILCASPGCQNPDVIGSNVITELPLDVTGLPSGDYAARVTFCDEAGNKTSVVRNVTLNREPPYLRLVGLDRSVFSPNGDGRSDTVTATFNLAQALAATGVVRANRPEGPVVRTLFTGLTLPAGNDVLTWDGRGTAGAVLPDGSYWLELSGLDPCGRTGRVGVKVELDVTPPDVLITAPAQGAHVLGSIDVTGVAWDMHFAGWALESRPAGAAWATVGERTAAVGSPAGPGRFGRWDTPAETGPYELRLTGRDLAENERQVVVAVQVDTRTRLESLAAEPDLFSPNGDGRRDATAITYVLNNPGRVTLEIRARGGPTVRLLESGAEHPAGAFGHAWDGRADGGAEAPDGEYDVHVRVEDPLGLAPAEEGTITVEVDRQPPVLSLGPPSAGAFVDRNESVHAAAQDRNLADWTLQATLSGGSMVELAHGVQEQPSAAIATLSRLEEGAHVLRLESSDRADNRSHSEVAVTIDSIPPVVALQAPAPASVWPKSAPVEVTGTATDTNLLRWTLSAGPGPSPASFDVVRTATTGGAGIAVGPWAVSGLPDDDYTLRLEGEDKAGHRQEARVTVAVDGTPPVAVISAPAEGGYVKEPRSILGSATDLHLESWSLEVSPGDAAGAYQWSPLGSGTSRVAESALADWRPLPPDGLYTLRLTVRDKAGLRSSALRTVTVDTTPPAPPRPKAQVIRKGGPTGDVLVTWDPNSEPDLAGYTIARGETGLRGLDPQTDYTDLDRPDGTYTYAVVAEDRAGNRSAPGTARITLDLTPPLADVLLPREGASVSGSVDITGTAWSAADFKEYRLSVGAGTAPTSFTLLRRSTLPVLAATLGAWTAVGEGPHVILLEAEDTSGNVAVARRSVVVDNHAPSAPVLLSVEPGLAPTALLSTWAPSPETDVAGYLVYRNGSVANAEGIVLGDLTPYLVPPPTYLDKDLPDGRFCYRVVAQDRAGNQSPASNEICRTLDNRPPHAEIVQPPNGLRFQFPIDVKARTPDLDVVSVQFQIKADADSTWHDLGPADTREPWQVTLDPVGLSFGVYDLRAVARDAARADPEPGFVTVAYGDTTKPAPPTGLGAAVDGRRVRLTWNANLEADLDHYVLRRDGEPVYGGPDRTFDDDRDPGTYAYTVAAVDHDGNESGPSDPATAVVYAVQLQQPFPVTLAAVVDLAGDGALPDTTLDLSKDDGVVASVAASGPAFAFAGVPIALEGNVFTARGRDAAGNRSIASNEVVIIGNAPPGPVTGLVATPVGRVMTLGWDAASEPDVFGFAVRREGAVLTGSLRQTEGEAVSGSPYYCSGFSPCNNPPKAFDGDPSTVWVPVYWSAPEHDLIVRFPEPVLVEKVKLRFAWYTGASTPVPDYRVEALWEGRFIPLVSVRDNLQSEVEHAFPSAFATDQLRVVIRVSGYMGISELEVTRSALVSLATPTFTDASAVKDGPHTWEVAAVDRYGAYGPWARVEREVDRLSKPTGFAGVPDGSDAALTWSPNPEPDIDHYDVFRDGAFIGTAPASLTPTYRDVGLPNATYLYTVSAVATDGNESEGSDPAAVTIAVQPPQAPVLRAVATPRGQVDLEWDHPGAPVYALYRSTASGGPYTLRVETPQHAYRDTTATLDVQNFYVVVARDELGNPSPASNEASATPRRTEAPSAPVILFPTDAAHPLTLRALRTLVRGRADSDSVVTLRVNGVVRGEVAAAGLFAEQGLTGLPAGVGLPLMSLEGRRLAYGRYDDLTGRITAVVRDVATGESRDLENGEYAYVSPVAFAPGGERLLAQTSGIFPDGSYHQDLHVFDLRTAGRVAVEDGDDASISADWSPDGTRIAYATHTSSTVCRLGVLDLDTGVTSTLDGGDGCPLALRWSPAGDRIAFSAWTGSRYEGRIADPATGGLVVVDAQVNGSLAWSASGEQVAYAWGDYPSRIRVFDLATGGHRDLTDGVGHSYQPAFDPLGRWLAYLAESPSGYRLVALDVASDAVVDVVPPSALQGFAWTASGYLAAFREGSVSFHPGFEGSFEILDVPLAPGENLLVAEARDPASGLRSPESLPVTITVPEDVLPDLAVAPADLYAAPLVPRTGQPALLVARVRNLGGAAAENVPVRLRLTDPGGQLLVDTTSSVPRIEAGASAVLSVPWVASAAGVHRALVEADPGEAIVEAHEDNNRADREITVVPLAGLSTSIGSDRELYPAHAPALVTVRVVNGGASFQGTARTVVEDAAGNEVTSLDERPLALDYGQETLYDLPWNTGTTYAGDYRFRLRLADGSGSALPGAERAFRIEPERRAAARLVPDAASVPQGTRAGFAATVESLSANAIMSGLAAHLAIRPEGSAGPPVFEADTPVGVLVPGGSWAGPLAWPVAAPAGHYAAELRVLDGPNVLATASARFEVTAEVRLAGTIATVPGHVLAGDGFEARLEVRNLGLNPVSGLPVRVEVVSGASAAVQLVQSETVDLAPAAVHQASLAFSSSTLAPGPYSVRLRAGDPAGTLAMAALRVHGLIAPPSVHAPADGSTVDTPHPVLTVNNATSAEGAPLLYEYQLFLDAGLTMALPGAAGRPETPSRTSWRVATSLGEDQVYWWRARVTDGFSTSGWSAVASFRVDALNLPPGAPVPVAPTPGERVASRQPTLLARNAHDPENDVLTYDFRLAEDPGMATIVVSTSGVAEGDGFTGWPLPVLLDEDKTYCWDARASDGRNRSPFSVPACFLVDTVNLPPTAPVPLRPIGGAGVPTITPELAVGPARDPEGSPLTYVIEVDRSSGFDSSEKQASPALAEAGDEAAWTPPVPLVDNALYHWRAAASDGVSHGPWAYESFFVNLGNDPPTTPVPQSPVGGAVVGTLTPELRVRNATDPDRDVLTYDFALADSTGTVVAQAEGLAEGVDETGWVTPGLAEDQVYQWRARASDGQAASEWSAWETFRVKVAPGAPGLVAPPEGSTVGERRPLLVVSNATSPRGSTLTYTFELYTDAAGAPPTLVDRIEGQPEQILTTSWRPGVDLADGPYSWRARAFDGTFYGPWMASARFAVAVDEPPAPPTGLSAVPGDRRVDLTWNLSPEPDVIGYRVYRSLNPGGPYTGIADSTTPAYSDLGLTNGVTYRYVVTARDARFESGYSDEAAATPQAPSVLPAEVSFDPSTVSGECLLFASCRRPSDRDALRGRSRECDDDRDDDRPTLVPRRGAARRLGLREGLEGCSSPCPEWIRAAIELPAGYGPGSIDPATVRLAGTVAADGVTGTTDRDRDGIPELLVRFAFGDVAPLLRPGANPLAVTGRAGGVEFSGRAILTVVSPRVDLFFTPRTLERRSRGNDVQVQLQVADCMDATKVSVASLRLNETVPVGRVVSVTKQKLIVKFDRRAALAVLPDGDSVEVRVSGTIAGQAFVAKDVIRVTE